MSLIVFGSIAFDHIITPQADSGKIVGGAAFYAAIAAANFVDDIKLLAVIGNDFPQAELDFLTSRHIAYDGVQKVTDKPSFFWKGSYHKDMNNRDSLDTQLNALLDFKATVPDNYQDCTYLLLGNLDPALQLKVIEQLATRPKLIALDTMNFWMEIALDNLKKVLQKIDLLIINESEAKELSGENNLTKAAKKIRAMGPVYLIIKKGEHGALLFYEDKIFATSALVIENIFDPTGAGDTFAGALMGYIAQHQSHDFETLKAAMVAGSAVASFCTEKFGATRLKEIDRTHINQRIQELKQLTAYTI